MTDPRNKKLAKILVDYSTAVKKGSKVWIRATTPLALPLAREVYKLALLRGAFPSLDIGDEFLSYFYYQKATEEQLKKKPQIAEFIANWADKVITIVADENTRELANTDPKRVQQRSKITRPISDIILKKDWVLCWYPTASMAQEASLALEELEDFYFRSCNLDWASESKKWQKLARLLTERKKLEIVGEKTRLKMSVGGRKFKADDGKNNMPGGEVFSAPVDDSVEGKIYFNFPLTRQGKTMREISLEFKKGKVVGARASEHEAFLKEIVNTDKGARRVGEIAIGLNPGVKKYMNNTLFDEKMAGTIHLALGQAYEDCGGVNKSAVHMDMVKDMRKKGSRVVADGKTILEDGEIVVKL